MIVGYINSVMRVSRYRNNEYNLKVVKTTSFTFSDIALVQWLGSGSESVGSARFWLPGSGFGSAKICGSTAKKIKFYS